MDRLSLYRELDAFFPSSYRLKLFVVGAVGTYVPLLIGALWTLTDPAGWKSFAPELLVLFTGALVGSALSFAGLDMLLHPVKIATEILAAYRADRTIGALETGFKDSAGVLLSNLFGLLVEVEQTIADADRMAFSDDVTGLINRRCFTAMIDERFNGGLSAYQSIDVAVFDLDHFEWIKDEFGDGVGDVVLTTFADVLRRVVKEKHYLSRIGEKRFAILFTDVAAERVDAVCNDARLLIKLWRILPQVVTVSVGTASRAKGETVAQTLARAEAALCAAKRSGRNRVMHAGRQALQAAE